MSAFRVSGQVGHAPDNPDSDWRYAGHALTEKYPMSAIREVHPRRGEIAGAAGTEGWLAAGAPCRVALHSEPAGMGHPKAERLITRQLVAAERDRIERIADALLEHGVLSAA